MSLFGHFRTQSPRAHQPYSQHTPPLEPFGRWYNSCVAPRHFIWYRTKCSVSRFRIRKSVCYSSFTITWRMDVRRVWWLRGECLSLMQKSADWYGLWNARECKTGFNWKRLMQNWDDRSLCSWSIRPMCTLRRSNVEKCSEHYGYSREPGKV